MEGQNAPSVGRALEVCLGEAYHLHQIREGVINPWEQVPIVYLFLEVAFLLLRIGLEELQGRDQNSNQSSIEECFMLVGITVEVGVRTTTMVATRIFVVVVGNFTKVADKQEMVSQTFTTTIDSLAAANYKPVDPSMAVGASTLPIALEAIELDSTLEQAQLLVLLSSHKDYNSSLHPSQAFLFEFSLISLFSFYPLYLSFLDAKHLDILTCCSSFLKVARS